MPPLRLLLDLAMVIGPKLWALLVEGKEPEEIGLTDLAGEMQINRLKRLAALERARRERA